MKKLAKNQSIQTEVETMISYVFGKYDMRKGDKNKLRMKKLLKYCMKDITEHPLLKQSLNNRKAMEYFVTQTIIYMMDLRG